MKKTNNEDSLILFNNNSRHTTKQWWKFWKLDNVFTSTAIKLLKIIIEFIVISWIVITITFFLLHSVPGTSAITAGLTEDSAKALNATLGKDLPLWVQYWRYLGGIIQGQFGISESIRPFVQINEFVWVKFGKSFLVGIFSVLLTLIIGIPMGIWIGKNPGGFLDNFSTVVISIINSIPSLVLALILLLIGTQTNMPVMYDEQNLMTFILPGLALSLGSTITYIKYLRTELNSELNSMHAKFAYLKGVSKSRFVWRHALKPALFPIATFFPIVILGSFLGSMYIEKVYFIAGSGSTMIEAIQAKDTNVVLFMIIVYSVLIILSYTLRDALYGVLDPRVRKGGK